MPKARAKAADAANLGFNQPNPPSKRRKKAAQNQANSAGHDGGPAHQNHGITGPMVAQNPFDDQPQYHHPNSMPGMPGMPYGGGPGGPGPRPGMMSGSFNYPQMPGGHRITGPLPPPSGHLNAGKVYPPNASMVFNPSNPNAPPIYPCGICHKEVHDNDQAILCESGCNFWFHRGCTGLTDVAFHMLTQEVYAEWVCDKCLSTKNIPLVKMKP